MIIVLITSHLFQLARIFNLSSFEVEPKVNPAICAAGACSVNMLTMIIEMIQKRNMPPLKNNQLVSKNKPLNHESLAAVVVE